MYSPFFQTLRGLLVVYFSTETAEDQSLYGVHQLLGQFFSIYSSLSEEQVQHALQDCFMDVFLVLSAQKVETRMTTDKIARCFREWTNE